MCLFRVLLITVLLDAVSSTVYYTFPSYSTSYNYYYSNYKLSTTYYTKSCSDYCSYSYNTCGYYGGYNSATVYTSTKSRAAGIASVVGIAVGTVLAVVILGVSFGLACYCGRVKRVSPGQILTPVTTSPNPYTPMPDLGCHAGVPGADVTSPPPPYPAAALGTTMDTKNDATATSNM